MTFNWTAGTKWLTANAVISKNMFKVKEKCENHPEFLSRKIISSIRVPEALSETSAFCENS